MQPVHVTVNDTPWCECAFKMVQHVLQKREGMSVLPHLRCQYPSMDAARSDWQPVIDTISVFETLSIEYHEDRCPNVKRFDTAGHEEV